MGMPAIRAAKKKGKPAAAPRTRPRVTDTEDTSGATVKSAAHKQTQTPVGAQAQALGNGAVLITAQLSELVPVAQYANVTLGPNQISWKLDADMGVLAEVDWESDDPLTDEQQQVFDRVMGAMRATTRLLEIHLAEDRETVERSVRQHNEREASEASEKKQSRARRR
jgi:hypothetical protein